MCCTSWPRQKPSMSSFAYSHSTYYWHTFQIILPIGCPLLTSSFIPSCSVHWVASATCPAWFKHRGTLFSLPQSFCMLTCLFWKQQIIQCNWIKHGLCKPEWKHVETERGGFSITWEETNTTNQAHCYTSSLLCHTHNLQVSTAKSQCTNYRKKTKKKPIDKHIRWSTAKLQNN